MDMSDWTWMAAAFEALVALGLLSVACFVLWKRLGSTYFLIASGGFLIGVVGNAYRAYVFSHAGALCDGGAEKMAQFIECTNQLAAYGSVVAATGLIISAVAFLIYALKTQLPK